MELKDRPACTGQCGIKPTTNDIDKETLQVREGDEDEAFPSYRVEGEVHDEAYVDGRPEAGVGIGWSMPRSAM